MLKFVLIPLYLCLLAQNLSATSTTSTRTTDPEFILQAAVKTAELNFKNKNKNMEDRETCSEVLCDALAPFLDQKVGVITLNRENILETVNQAITSTLALDKARIGHEGHAALGKESLLHRAAFSLYSSAAPIPVHLIVNRALLALEQAANENEMRKKAEAVGLFVYLIVDAVAHLPDSLIVEGVYTSGITVANPQEDSRWNRYLNITSSTPVTVFTFISATVDPKVSELFIAENAPCSIHYTLTKTSGIDISPFSQFKAEYEFMILPLTRFSVKTVEFQNNKNKKTPQSRQLVSLQEKDSSPLFELSGGLPPHQRDGSALSLLFQEKPTTASALGLMRDYRNTTHAAEESMRITKMHIAAMRMEQVKSDESTHSSGTSSNLITTNSSPRQTADTGSHRKMLVAPLDQVGLVLTLLSIIQSPDSVINAIVANSLSQKDFIKVLAHPNLTSPFIRETVLTRLVHPANDDRSLAHLTDWVGEPNFAEAMANLLFNRDSAATSLPMDKIVQHILDNEATCIAIATEMARSITDADVPRLIAMLDLVMDLLHVSYQSLDPIPPGIEALEEAVLTSMTWLVDTSKVSTRESLATVLRGIPLLPQFRSAMHSAAIHWRQSRIFDKTLTHLVAKFREYDPTQMTGESFKPYKSLMSNEHKFAGNLKALKTHVRSTHWEFCAVEALITRLEQTLFSWNPTFLQMLAYCGDENLLAALIASPAILGTTENLIVEKDKYGANALHYAALGGSVACVNIVMRLNGINITSTNNAGISVSHYAARGGNLDCLKYCINLGGGTKPNDLDIGLAHYAALGGCPQCVDYCLSLLPKKPDGTTTLPLSKEGATTTHYATMSGNIECIKHCIKKGVGSLDSKSNSEATCVHYAALGGCVDALKWCLAHEGGSGTDRDKMGLSLTHYAVFGSSVLALEYCLESEGGDIDVPSKGQGTPWNFIIKMGNPDILKFCEKKGILKSYEEKGLIKFNTLYKRYELVTTPKPTEVTPPSTNSVD